jgi:hypothetical protein
MCTHRYCLSEEMFEDEAQTRRKEAKYERKIKKGE